MKRVAVTGISGYIGNRLLPRLALMENVEKVIGVDIKPPQYRPPKLQFYCQDISMPMGDIFIENKVDTVIHLAFVLKPTRDKIGAQRVDVGGILNLLEACRQAQVAHIISLSSHTVYGAHADNPLYLEETRPLRPLRDFQYSWDKAQTERILQQFVSSPNETCVTILRSCPVIGPNAAGSVVSLMFKPPVIIGISGFDPPMQFVHEDDVVELLTVILNQKKPGIFNVAGDGEVAYSQVARLAGKRMLALPEKALRLLMRFSWAAHLQNESPTSGLEFIKYPPIVSTEKLKRETGFQFSYSSREALASFLSSGQNKG